MKPIIIDMKDMSDSTEVYKSRPHPFFVIFIYLILAMLLTAFTWMHFWKLDIVVKSSGIFKMEDNISNVSSSSTGKILICNLTEGEYVNKGDLLFSIDHTNSDIELQAYEKLLADTNDRLAIMDAYIKYLDGDISYMDALSDNQYYSEYLNRGELIKLNMDVADTNSDNQAYQCQQSVTSISKSIDYYQQKSDNYEKAVKAVKTLKNTFSEKETYFFMLVDNYIQSYNLTISQYDSQISEYKETRDMAAKDMKEEYNKKIRAAQKEKKSALRKIQREQLTSIEQQIEAIKGTMISLAENLETAKSQLSVAKSGTERLTNEASKLTEKNAISSEKLTYENQKTEYENTIQTLLSSIEKCEVKAAISGYVSLQTEMKSGSYVQEGTAICQIIPENSQEYYAEVYVSNSDIGKLEVGQDTKFEISAYPSSEYGYFTGVISTISKDIKVDSDTKSAYYLVKVKCDNSISYNMDGDKANIMNGMACQAKIITDEQSVLEYILKKINILG